MAGQLLQKEKPDMTVISYPKDLNFLFPRNISTIKRLH